MTRMSSSKDATSKRNRFSPESTESLITALTTLKARLPRAVNVNVHTYPSDSVRQASSSSAQHGSDSRGEEGAAVIERSAAPNTADGQETMNDMKYITSWKMSEHLYRRKDCPFPTLARGLFTATDDYSSEEALDHNVSSKGGVGNVVEAKDEKKEVRIVARGYDKFFNVGEVEWTEVSLGISISCRTTSLHEYQFQLNFC